MKDALVALVRQSILTVLDEANPRTPGLAWDFNDDEQRVDFADRVAAFLPSAPVSETATLNEEGARAQLGKAIADDDGLYSLGWYLAWTPGEANATLDGQFNIEDLEAVAWWMRNKGKRPE